MKSDLETKLAECAEAARTNPGDTFTISLHMTRQEFAELRAGYNTAVAYEALCTGLYGHHKLGIDEDADEIDREGAMQHAMLLNDAAQQALRAFRAAKQQESG